MTIFITLLLVIVTLALIVYPYLRARPVTANHTKGKSAIKSKVRYNEEDIEEEILKLRQRKNKVCPRCGAGNSAGARFCSQCATPLIRENKNG